MPARRLEPPPYDLSEVWPQHLNEHGECGLAVDRDLRKPRLSALLFRVKFHLPASRSSAPTSRCRRTGSGWASASS